VAARPGRLAGCGAVLRAPLGRGPLDYREGRAALGGADEARDVLGALGVRGRVSGLLLGALLARREKNLLQARLEPEEAEAGLLSAGLDAVRTLRAQLDIPLQDVHEADLGEVLTLLAEDLGQVGEINQLPPRGHGRERELATAQGTPEHVGRALKKLTPKVCHHRPPFGCAQTHIRRMPIRV